MKDTVIIILILIMCIVNVVHYKSWFLIMQYNFANISEYGLYQ